MLVKGNCGGMIPVDDNTFGVNAKGELTMNVGEQNAVPFKNIDVEGDATINHLDVVDSIVVPDPTDEKEAVNKKYADAHYIMSPNGTQYRITVNDNGELSATPV